MTSLFLVSNLNAVSSFSGYAGGKVNYASDPEVEDYDPNLKLQAFFAGQFNFSQNIWSHMEFSIDTAPFSTESIFNETDAIFQLDEISLIMRGNFANSSNYFSAFMGTYDPVGSDIFLKRYFGIQSISSKITDSYLGLAGSILYPQFGIGISDVLKLHSLPLAFGGYMYVNHEDPDFYVYNLDLRTAGVLRYLTWDFACGIGVPIANKYKGEDVIFAIDKVYWHAGTTVLIGNNFTNSLFIQAGICNAAFTAKDDDVIVKPEDTYILFEPRFFYQNLRINISLYSLPENTIKKLLFIDDTLGININMFLDSLMLGSTLSAVGMNFAMSYTGKKLVDLKDISNLTEFGQNLTITPYIKYPILSGELHFQTKFNLSDMGETPAKAFSFDLGYRTNF